MRGEEIRRLLDERVQAHEARAAHWRERIDVPVDDDDPKTWMPDHICENGAEEHEWRARVLMFVRDHIEADELYRLDEVDLEFGELLPEKPGWMEQAEYEERTAVASNLDRLRRELRASRSCGHDAERAAETTE
jgi:hypothetical protein